MKRLLYYNIIIYKNTNSRFGRQTMSRKILIVGGVAGGASAAARLRRLDEP